MSQVKISDARRTRREQRALSYRSAKRTAKRLYDAVRHFYASVPDAEMIRHVRIVRAEKRARLGVAP